MSISLYSKSKTNNRVDLLKRGTGNMSIASAPFSSPLTTLEADALGFRAGVTSPQPIVNGVSLAIDPILAKRNPWSKYGYIDPTRWPFFADPSGRKDATASLSAALDYARKYFFVVMAPKDSQFKISDTLDLRQGSYRRQGGTVINTADERACLILIGQEGGSKPKIFLADNASGFNNTALPKVMLRFWGVGNSGSTAGYPTAQDMSGTYNLGLTNIEMVTGANAGAVCAELRGAQGCFVTDCTFNATGGFAGIQGMCGPGAPYVNNKLIGGRYGIRGDRGSFGDTLSWFGNEFIDQTVSAILMRNDSLETMSFFGVKIQMAAGATGPAFDNNSSQSNRGYLILADCRIDFPTVSSANVAIATNRSIKLLNVFTRGCGKIVDLTSTTSTTDGINPHNSINAWSWIKEASICVKPPLKTINAVSVQFESNRYANYNGVGGGVYTDTRSNGATGNPPQSDIVSRHHWGDGGLITANTPGVKNAKVIAQELNLTLYGDGREEGATIQAVANAWDKIFWPKGYYASKFTITTRPDSQWCGVSRDLTVFVPINTAGGDFTVVTAPKYCIETTNGADDRVVLSQLGIYSPQAQGGSGAIKWRCGDRSMWFNVRPGQFNISGFVGDTVEKRAPALLISGPNAGGRFWGVTEILSLSQFSTTYAIIKVENTVLPLRLMGCNPEHADRGKANVWITNSSNVHIIATKWESDHDTSGDNAAVYAENSSNFSILGTGGIYENAIDDATDSPPANFEIDLCNNFLISSIMDRSNATLDYADTISVTEQVSPGVYVHTEKLHRPFEYSRGTFDWVALAIPRVS